MKDHVEWLQARILARVRAEREADPTNQADTTIAQHSLEDAADELDAVDFATEAVVLDSATDDDEPLGEDTDIDAQLRPPPRLTRQRRFPTPPTRVTAIDPLGDTFVPFEQRTTTSPRGRGFEAPKYLTRSALHYDGLARFLHALTDRMQASPAELARAFGLGTDDVEAAVERWTTHLERSGTSCEHCGARYDQRYGGCRSEACSQTTYAEAEE